MKHRNKVTSLSLIYIYIYIYLFKHFFPKFKKMPFFDSGSRLNSGWAEGLAAYNDVHVLIVNAKVTFLRLKVFKIISKTVPTSQQTQRFPIIKKPTDWCLGK